MSSQANGNAPSKLAIDFQLPCASFPCDRFHHLKHRLQRVGFALPSAPCARYQDCESGETASTVSTPIHVVSIGYAVKVDTSVLQQEDLLAALIVSSLGLSMADKQGEDSYYDVGYPLYG